MDIKRKNAAKLTKSNICRCCLKPGCFKSFSEEYYYLGQKEVYEEMLETTFDIRVSHKSNQTLIHLVCEDCITKLREATTFKQMVLHNEKRYLQIIETMEFDHDGEAKRMVKLEDIKCESSSNLMDFGDDSFDEDDEILANIKKELETDLSSVQKKEYALTHAGDTRLKKCKIKTDIDHKPQKDWSRIIERRGNGPMLRENSLKLLANSTIFVFQWNKSRYCCFCCKEPFSNITLLKEHTHTHTLKAIEKKIIDQQNRLVKVEISVLKCKICDVTLQNLNTLKEHLIDSHNFEFELKEDLLVPFKIDEELSCQLCAEKFTMFRNLNIHMNKHFQKQTCHICGAGFSNLHFLNLHKTRSHKPIKCRQCDLTFSNKIDKKKHEITIHKIKYERMPRFPCPYCNQRFFQENLRVKHLIEKHGLKKPEFKCSICTKIFLTKSICNNHLKSVHFKEKKHECDICHNLFYSNSDVLRHKVTHTGEKNFSCELCNNLFANKDSVKRHMKRTHGVSPEVRGIKAQRSTSDKDPCPVFI